MPKPICAGSCSVALRLENNGEILRLNRTEIITLYFYSSQNKALLLLPPCTLLEQDLILLDDFRRLVNSKHNQTLWAVCVWRGIESISCRVLWWQNLQLPSACKCSLHWNFSISSLHSSCPIRKPTGSSGSSTADRVIRAPRGEFFQAAAVNSSFCLEKIHVYTNRRCSKIVFLQPPQ